MVGTLHLIQPIDINGKKVAELPYDTDAITSTLFAEADSRKMKAAHATAGNLSGAVELDYSFHLYLGFAAIIAANSAIDFNDLERIKGYDVMEVMNVGRNFIMRRDADSQEEDSIEQSETTPDVSTTQSQNSKKNQ